MSTTILDQSDNFAERLRFWRVSQDLTQAEAALQLDIDRSYLSQVERGRPPGNSLRTRFQLMEKSSPAGIKTGGQGLPAIRNVPLLTWTQAGESTSWLDSPQKWDEVVPSDAPDEGAFAVRLQGDSMEPRFSDGDIAVLLPGVAATNGDTVVANLRGEGVICKIMQVQCDRNLITLSSYNPAYPPMERHRDQFHWIFPITTILKRLRRA